MTKDAGQESSNSKLGEERRLRQTKNDSSEIILHIPIPEVRFGAMEVPRMLSLNSSLHRVFGTTIRKSIGKVRSQKVQILTGSLPSGSSRTYAALQRKRVGK